MLLDCHFVRLSIYSKTSKNSNSDFSKYSLIRNKFWTQWIQRIGPVNELF